MQKIVDTDALWKGMDNYFKNTQRVPEPEVIHTSHIAWITCPLQSGQVTHSINNTATISYNSLRKCQKKGGGRQISGNFAGMSSINGSVENVLG